MSIQSISDLEVEPDLVSAWSGEGYGEKESIEDIEITVLLEAVFQRYGFDFRHYAPASLKRRIRRGGLTIVQSPATAESSHMPNAALATGAVDKVLPLEEIVPFLTKWGINRSAALCS